jgi:general secretion pathway protein G
MIRLEPLLLQLLGRPHIRRRGFTLVEIAIALLIIGVLVALAVPMIGDYRERALVSQAKMDIELLSAEIDRWIRDFGNVPVNVDRLSQGKLDPWGRPYKFLNVSASAPPEAKGKARKDKNLVPINSDYDLYSMGKDGKSVGALTAKESRDDIVRANNGAFVGLAADY